MRRYGRKTVFTLSLVWSVGLYWLVAGTIPSTSAALSTLMRYYAFSALTLLFVTLIPGLLVSYFPHFRYNGILVHLRRAVGVSVFYFAFLHAMIGFFHNLTGKISAAFFLAPRHQWALLASTAALLILSLMAITSFNRAVTYLGKRWKQLHRLIYPVTILVLFHAFAIGSHFTVPTSPIPMAVNVTALVFIILETGATLKRGWARSKLGWIAAGLILFSAVFLSYWAMNSAYDPHARHRRGYSKDYAMNVGTTPQQVLPGAPATLEFSVTDKRTGGILKKYQVFQEKLMHVVVIRRDLAYYDHIHPEYDNAGTFRIVTTFPDPGTYYLFTEYSPPDFFENLSVAAVTVGDAKGEAVAHLAVDERTKIFEDMYKITLDYKDPIKVNDAVDFTYTIRDARTDEPVTELETYLAAFGHMAAVSEDTQTYTHVHPVTVPLAPSDHGGPQVAFNTFFPKAGLYKLFTQFKHKGKVFVTDFVVEVL